MMWLGGIVTAAGLAAYITGLVLGDELVPTIGLLVTIFGFAPLLAGWSSFRTRHR